MSINYEFYVYANGKNKGSFFSLNSAMELFNKTRGKYVTLGVSESLRACDLIIKENNNIKLSQDINSSSFKHEKIITLNAVSILKKQFNL